MNPNSSRGPIHPRDRGQAFPWVAAAISGACAVVWLVALASQGQHPLPESPLGSWMALRTERFDLRSLVTHSFLHESSLHLLVNIACIVYAGRALEKRWGALRFLTFYLASALVVGLSTHLVSLCAAHAVATPGGTAWISFGASGPALACLAAYSIVGEDRPLLGCLSERYAIWAGMVLGAAGLLLLERMARDSKHGLTLVLIPQVGGIAGGIALRFGMSLWDRADRWFGGQRLARRKSRESEIRLRVDQLLEKISRDGLESLSWEEHSFLRDASKHFRNPD